VPTVSPQTLLVGQHIPDFAGAIMTGREHQVAWLREELYLLDTFSVTLKCVDPLLWNKVRPRFLGLEVLGDFSKLGETYFLPMKGGTGLEHYLFFFLHFSFLGLSCLFCSHFLVFFDGFLLFGS
jgi:hypothetical protein